MNEKIWQRIVFLIGITWLAGGCIPKLPFINHDPTASPDLGEGIMAASEFSSTGDLIQGWYWLRDVDKQETARWVFTGVPEGKDLILHWTVLATDRADGGGGNNAKFIVFYGVPKSGPEGWLTLGSREITLPNKQDPSGYLCEGETIIFRSELSRALSAETMWFMVGRQDPNGVFLPVDMHVAFNSGSLAIEPR